MRELNGAHGGVSIYAGLTLAPGASLMPAGAIPAGAGLPWDEQEAARGDGLCGEHTKAGGVCTSRPAGSGPLCIGHTKGVVKALIAAGR